MELMEVERSGAQNPADSPAGSKERRVTDMAHTTTTASFETNRDVRQRCTSSRH